MEDFCVVPPSGFTRSDLFCCAMGFGGICAASSLRRGGWRIGGKSGYRTIRGLAPLPGSADGPRARSSENTKRVATAVIDR